MNMSAAWRKWLKVFLVANLVVSPIFLCIAIGCSSYVLWFTHHAIRVEGRVIGFDEHQVEDETAQTSSPPVTYSPIFEFKLSDGGEHVVHSAAGSNPPGFVIGQSVSVLALPNHPEIANIESFDQLWGLVLGFGIAAVLTATIGLIGRFSILGRKTFAEISMLPS
jgi:hypothetical protein